MIKIRAFEKADIIHMDLLPYYSREIDTKGSILGMVEAPDSIRRTLLTVRGEVLAVVGGLIHYQAMSVWAAVSINILKHPKAYHKGMAELIDRTIDEFNLARVQSIVAADNLKAVKQHKLWGFVCEGLMRKSGPGGKDEYIFAKVVD